MKTTFPVIFTKDEGIYLVKVPDLDLMTQGADLVDATVMARDIICLHCVTLQDRGETIPSPSSIHDITTEHSEDILTLVDVDVTDYRKQWGKHNVRRNVSLPSWLDYSATKAGVNVSAILQKALIETLGVQAPQ